MGTKEKRDRWTIYNREQGYFYFTTLHNREQRVYSKFSPGMKREFSPGIHFWIRIQRMPAGAAPKRAQRQWGLGPWRVTWSIWRIGQLWRESLFLAPDVDLENPTDWPWKIRLGPWRMIWSILRIGTLLFWLDQLWRQLLGPANTEELFFIYIFG